jgi:hypothetical protein
MVPIRFEEQGEWKRLGNKELYDLYDLYRSPNIVLVIQSRKIRCAGHVAHNEGQERCMQGFGGETRRERDHLEGLGQVGG